jgi:hypothetical protein
MGSTERKLSIRHRQNVIHRCGWVLNFESIIPEDTTSSIVVILLIYGGPNSTNNSLFHWVRGEQWLQCAFIWPICGVVEVFLIDPSS